MAKKIKKRRTPRVRYSKALGERICDYVAQGYTLRQIEQFKGMPNKRTIISWALDEETKPEFVTHYVRARVINSEGDIDRIDDIVEMTATRQRNGILESCDVAFLKVQIETAQWKASITRPNIYGDKKTIEHQGSINLSNKTDAELLAIING